MSTSRRSKSERVAESRMPIDLIVDRGFLLDIGVGRGDVGLGLVVVVVADEILHGIVRKVSPELLNRAAPPESCYGPERVVGRLSFSTTFAIVKVLPDPVTPSST